MTAPPATDAVRFARGSTSVVQEDGSVLKSLHKEREEGGENIGGFWHRVTYLEIFGCLTPGGCCGI